MAKKFPFYLQMEKQECGAACLKMVCQFYGKDVPIRFLKDNTHIGPQGVSLLGISTAAEKMGMRTTAVKSTLKLLKTKAQMPCIAHWDQNHFVVVYKIAKGKIHVADPQEGLVEYGEEAFCQKWFSDIHKGEGEGVLLLLSPSPLFYEKKQNLKEKKLGWGFLFRYFNPYKSLFWQLVISMLLGTFLELVFPFLTQATVDFGINHEDLDFIYVVMAGQLMVFAGRAVVKVIRGHILLHVSARMNIALISDFLIKLMKLPISFFDSRDMADILQRIRDHNRIELFLTHNALGFVTAVLLLSFFSVILLLYNLQVFLLFALGTFFYMYWVLRFMKRRKDLDHRLFNRRTAANHKEIQLISGMQEIKMHNSEKQKRWEWEEVQSDMFDLKVEVLNLNQWQRTGALSINELKNILITFWSAKEVIEGNMTLGMMMAVSYILGRLDSVITDMLALIESAQDAKISLDRVTEVHLAESEERDEISDSAFLMPEKKDIEIKNLFFRYNDIDSDYVLNDLNFTIPYGKTTAVVGASGSGKTTILKLLLKFYQAEKGKIQLGNLNINNISHKEWRKKCGAVLQEGYIFSDTIAKNICIGSEEIDKARLVAAAETANIRDMIEDLPLNYNTKIGAHGLSLSQGQKQRLLIARLVYKQPDFLFFDEATSALDANNEKIIMENLDRFTQSRTVFVIAHRLSTVKNADQIIVLHKGKVAEIGNHQSLTAKRGMYYELVKNQLELGS